jgi:3-oxoadipate enol-lactonase
MSDLPAVHYKIEGSGFPLTLIHGVGASLESWDGVIAALGEGFQILRYDLRGHGDSEKRPAQSLADLCADLSALLDRAGFAKTHLCGFSLGGIIAQAFAVAHPERIDRLALISAAAGRTADERARVLARADTLAKGGAKEHLASAVPRWFTDEFRARHPEVVKARLRRSLTNDHRCYAAAYRILARSDLAAELPKISAPTLVITGECDAGSTPRMARLIAARIPDARMIILKKLKHALLLEAPQKVGAELRRFFRGGA